MTQIENSWSNAEEDLIFGQKLILRKRTFYQHLKVKRGDYLKSDIFKRFRYKDICTDFCSIFYCSPKLDSILNQYNSMVKFHEI